MSLYIKYLSIWFRSQMQYRASFWLMTAGQFFIPFSIFAGLYLLFERFGHIQGWNFYEVALCFGIIHLSFSITECFARGYDTFSNLIVTGDFDRLLVRPRSTFVQVLGSNFEFNRIGRMLQSILVFGWAITQLPIEWSIWKGLILLLMVVSGVFIFVGIYILVATLSFWTIQGLEVANIFTDGGREMAQYPLNIYHRSVTRFFTYVIPFGCVNFLPLLYLLDRVEHNEWLYALSPLAGIFFFFPCLLVWRFGVRYYRSTGS